MRVAMSSAGAEPRMPATKSAVNQGSEYWYMGSTDARSVMQKYRTDARKATGR